ncbi:MAG: hypothetical protein OXB96_00790 [Candidatus Kaiserbacteria bacterium]|nr:hypothetical protein [Candidatus Kaiserbacteria bacterium]
MVDQQCNCLFCTQATSDSEECFALFCVQEEREIQDRKKWFVTFLAPEDSEQEFEDSAVPYPEYEDRLPAAVPTLHHPGLDGSEVE